MYQNNFWRYFGSTSSFILILLFTSCYTDNKVSTKVFRYNQINHITSLDPAFAKSQNNIWATHHLFNGLVQLDSNLNIIPDLAKSWEIKNKGKEYVFNIRSNVSFHKDKCFHLDSTNRMVKAKDFVYSFNRLLDQNLNSPGSWLFSDRIREDMPFTAPNDSTFILHLKEAFRPMLGILTMQYCSVVPKEAVDFYKSNFKIHPVGTGPFQFKKWIDNQALFLTKNKYYYESSISDTIPNFDGIKVLFINDRKIALLEVQNNKLDFFAGLESSFINDLLTKKGTLQNKYKNQLKFVKKPFLNMEYLGINQEALPKDSPLRIKEVRQAMNFALNKKLMLESLRNNVGIPANAGFIPKGLPSHDPYLVKGYRYNLTKAKELLKKIGYENGIGLPKIKLFTNKDYLDLCIFATKQWEKIGLDVEIEILETAVLRDGMRKSKIPFFRASWIADYPDGESFLCMFYSKHPAPPNYTRYKNSYFDILYNKSIIENNDSLRIVQYQHMDKMVIDDAPVIFLFYDESASIFNSRISNITGSAVNTLEPRSFHIN